MGFCGNICGILRKYLWDYGIHVVNLVQQSQQPQHIAEQVQQQHGLCAVPMPMMPPQAMLELLHQHWLAQTNSAFHFQPNGSLIPPPPATSHSKEKQGNKETSKKTNTVSAVSKSRLFSYNCTKNIIFPMHYISDAYMLLTICYSSDLLTTPTFPFFVQWRKPIL